MGPSGHCAIHENEEAEAFDRAGSSSDFMEPEPLRTLSIKQASAWVL
jgi:hypothetical protein